MSAIDFIEPIIRNAVRNQKVNPDDTVDENGFLICGKCRTPKQKNVEFCGEMRKVPVLCKCGEAEVQEEKNRKAKMEMEMEVDKLKKASLMDEKFRESTFASYQQNKHNARNFRLCKRYADGFDEMLAKNQGLLMYGDVGTGKSFAAACIGNQLLASCTSVVMTSFVVLLGLGQGFNGENEDKYIWRLNRAKLLIIDDLGAERSTDYALEKVYKVIDSRCRTNLPMILTTNLTLAEMQSATDTRYKRIYDRILEVCYPMEFSGTSWRERNAFNRFETMRDFLEGK